MKKLFDLLNPPFIDDMTVLLPVGEYYSVMINYNAQILFIDEVQHTLLLIEYLLISCESFCVYNFTETYSTDLKNPRFAKLYTYLQQLFSEEELTFEDNIVTTFEKVRLDWEFLGGQAYPIIHDREYLFNPYKEAEYSDKVDNILSKARAMFSALSVPSTNMMEG